MKKINILFLLFMSLCLAITLFGCNSKKETVTIKFAAWNLGSAEQNGIERQMVKAFMKQNPSIKVEIAEDFTKNYDAAMKAASVNNSIPDVFMYAGNPQANANGWCADLTNLAARDNEWNNIPQPLRDSASVRGKIIAVPTSMYFYGYFSNDNLFREKQVPLPKENFTVESFKTTIAKMTNIKEGSIGLADESSIIEWYPAAANKSLQWYSWDGGKFNLNSKEFIDGVKLARLINDNKQSVSLLSNEEKKNLKGTNDWEAWCAGTVAMKFDGTWSAADYSKLSYKVSFLGIPGGRICIVPDFMFVSKNCKHPEEAYKFIKFMSSYSSEGFAKRMEISKANGTPISTIPMTNDKKLIEDYFAGVKIDGIREAFNNLDKNSYVEGSKILPGYNQARWEYNTNISTNNKTSTKIGDVLIGTFRGSINIEEVANQLNSAANQCVQIYPRPIDN